MKKIKAFFADLEEPIVMSRGVWFYQLLAGILSGVILGILIAPPRKLKMGCNNGNNNVADGCGCGNGRCCSDEDDDTKNDEDKREND